ncbi:DNA-binding transcriptional regulator, AcrR family [Micromonospora pallida]|uniref:DNA-binding transcriptional regulator, AcrR family n=1 Tax=Micromonospora pallida TaxID=145854 RepID=A0A1C6SH82_9ACTN|nr:DNA-binding transcriptional regulator, AcrR family [Micromonospora pallida]
MTNVDANTSLRARKTLHTKRLLRQQALRLFRARGYEATTVEEIAAAAKVSDRTFFRYFTNKEAVLLNDNYEPALRAALEQLPTDRHPLETVLLLVRSALGVIQDDDPDELFDRARLTLLTPALRSALMDDVIRNERRLAVAISRATGLAPDTFSVRSAAAACVGAIRVAYEQWVAEEGRTSLLDLMEEALRPLADGLAFAGHRAG